MWRNRQHSAIVPGLAFLGRHDDPFLVHWKLRDGLGTWTSSRRSHPRRAFMGVSAVAAVGREARRMDRREQRVIDKGGWRSLQPDGAVPGGASDCTGCAHFRARKTAANFTSSS